MIHLIAKAIQRKRGLRTFATVLMLVSILFNAMPVEAVVQADNSLPVFRLSTSLDKEQNLVINSASGSGDDELTIRFDGSDIHVAPTNGGVISSGRMSIPAAEVSGSQIIINTGEGDDTLTIDIGDNSTPFTKEIVFNGQGQRREDTLKLIGTAAVDIAVFEFVNEHDGSIQLSGQAPITYTGLEPISSTITATDIILNYSSTSEMITITDAGGGQSTVDSNIGGEIVTFNNPSGSLVINAGDVGDDTINIDSLAANYQASIHIDGQGGSDTISVNSSLSTADEDINLLAETVNTTASIAAGAGSVAFSADTISVVQTVSGSGTLAIASQTAGNSIGLGGGTGTLNLTDAELAQFSDGFSGISIGDTSTGDISIDTATLVDNLTLITGGNIIDANDSGIDISNGANAVSIDGSLAPGSSPAIFTVNGNFAFADNSAYDVEIGGTTPGATGHDQLAVTGTVTIGSNVSLMTIAYGGFSPSVGDSFVIINNDGVDAISGTFSGMAEAALINNFLGSGLDAQITYAGGDGNDVVITVIGEPEIDMQRPAGTSIADGSTDYIGNYAPGTTVSLLYTIDNSAGTAPLQLYSLGMSGSSNVSNTGFGAIPAAIVPAGGSTTFGIHFDVGTPGPFGLDLTVSSTDSDEGTYNIRISGLVGDNRDINIQRPAGTAIADGDSDDLGNQTIGTVTATYTVSNVSGIDALTVTDVIADNLLNASNFSLNTVMPITVVAGGTGSFDVSFDVPVNGAFGFDMDILNDDADENPYDIAVSGTGTGGAPEIDMQRPAGTSIADGGVDNVGNFAPGATVNLLYTIDNSAGTAPLQLHSLGMSGSSNVSNTGFGAIPAAIVPAGGSTTFGIHFDVGTPGPFGLNLTISSTDSDEGTYNIRISGVSLDLAVVLGGNTSPLEGDVLTVNPRTLRVEFNREALGGGASVPGAADNPANYILVEDGPLDNGFATDSCVAGVIADDVRIPVDSVVYDNTIFTATLNLNGGAVLRDGSYRLLVCGTTSVEDLFGNELNGGLVDTLINFRVEPDDAAILPATGFAPGQVTILLAQPASQVYAETAMVLEIPALGQRMFVVEVLQSGESWDVTWLGENAGYLSGTAFPTWAGNTVITGHVWDAFNQPGPFANLNALQHGEQFYIHAFGMTYVYEVRENSLLQPTQVNKALQHEDYDWVTLLTCEAYDPQDDAYSLRRMVRAVLVDVR